MKALAMALAIIVTLNCSAYCDRGITASGEYVQDGICAMDKVNGVTVPFGSKVPSAGRTSADGDRQIRRWLR